jgi:hypothetical protein
LQAPGWQKELEGDHTPETEEYGISSFVFWAERPFHAERLMAAVEAGSGGVLRAKGWVWIASRPDLVASWSIAGLSMTLDPAGFWADSEEEGERPRQDECRAEVGEFESRPGRRLEMPYQRCWRRPVRGSSDVRGSSFRCCLKAREGAANPELTVR